MDTAAFPSVPLAHASTSVDISQYDAPEEANEENKTNTGPIKSEVAGRFYTKHTTYDSLLL